MNAIQQQKDYYDQYWTSGHTQYSGDNQGYAANFRNWMRTQLRGLPGDANILEVGCGDGSFTRNLAEHSSRVTAVDISAAQIERNARAHPEIKFLQHDVARAFPFELGLAGEFEVLQEHTARLERRRVLQRMFARAAGGLDSAQQEFVESFKRATFGTEEKRLGARLDAFLDEHQEAYLAAPSAPLPNESGRRSAARECRWRVPLENRSRHSSRRLQAQ